MSGTNLPDRDGVPAEMTTPPTEGHVETAVRAAYTAQRDAMVRADTATLSTLLDPSFTLTHVSGLVQSKQQWLAAIGDGDLQYDAIEALDTSIALDPLDPVLTVRTQTVATWWGARSTWRLQLRGAFRFDGARWLAIETVATLW